MGSLKGKKLSKENIAKRMETIKGRTLTKEQCKILSKRLIGHYVSEATKEKLRKINEKPIIVTFENGDIKEYESIKKCYELTGLNQSSIWRWLTNKHKNKKIKIEYKAKAILKVFN